MKESYQRKQYFYISTNIAQKSSFHCNSAIQISAKFGPFYTFAVENVANFYIFLGKVLQNIVKYKRIRGPLLQASSACRWSLKGLSFEKWHWGFTTSFDLSFLKELSRWNLKFWASATILVFTEQMYTSLNR